MKQYKTNFVNKFDNSNYQNSHDDYFLKNIPIGNDNKINYFAIRKDYKNKYIYYKNKNNKKNTRTNSNMNKKFNSKLKPNCYKMSDLDLNSYKDNVIRKEEVKNLYIKKHNNMLFTKNNKIFSFIKH